MKCLAVGVRQIEPNGMGSHLPEPGSRSTANIEDTIRRWEFCSQRLDIVQDQIVRAIRQKVLNQTVKCRSIQ